MESKIIIIVTTLIVTILAYLYTLQNPKHPIYQSSILIEIGHYDLDDGSIEIA